MFLYVYHSLKTREPSINSFFLFSSIVLCLHLFQEILNAKYKISYQQAEAEDGSWAPKQKNPSELRKHKPKKAAESWKLVQKKPSESWKPNEETASESVAIPISDTVPQQISRLQQTSISQSGVTPQPLTHPQITTIHQNMAMANDTNMAMANDKPKQTAKEKPSDKHLYLGHQQKVQHPSSNGKEPPASAPFYQHLDYGSQEHGNVFEHLLIFYLSHLTGDAHNKKASTSPAFYFDLSLMPHFARELTVRGVRNDRKSLQGSLSLHFF